MGEHQLDKLGVTGSSPVPPILTRIAIRETAWLCGQGVRVVRGMLTRCPPGCPLRRLWTFAGTRLVTPYARLGVHFSFSEADSNGMASTRGRPVAFSQKLLERASGYSYARRVRTRRGAQDLVYRMFAIAVIEHFCEAFPKNAETLQWLLEPRRHSLLSELGRVAKPTTGEDGELRFL